MKSTFILFVISVFISCNDSQKVNKKSATQQLQNATWLLGKWVNNTNDGELIEFWTKENDSALSGNSFLINNNDTLFSEKLRIKIINDTLYYIPTVQDQNSGQPVFFKLKSASKEQMVFENTNHDFPQLISYSRISADSIIAEISGLLDGKQSSRQFPMKKYK